MDGIWDGGDWISWDEINRHVYLQGLRDHFPHADPEVVEVFQDLVDGAAQYRALTGRHLDIFGELGELYAEIRFGIKRHRLRAAGSDGRRGNDFYEVKTIGPEKRTDKVQVKRAGHFNKLVIVRIDDDYAFDARVVDRKALNKGTGKLINVSWSRLEPSPAKGESIDRS